MTNKTLNDNIDRIVRILDTDIGDWIARSTLVERIGNSIMAVGAMMPLVVGMYLESGICRYDVTPKNQEVRQTVNEVQRSPVANSGTEYVDTGASFP